MSAENKASAENTATEQRGRPFVKGQSGNPSGRPKGARNRATIAMEMLLDGDAEKIMREASLRAQTGDPVALRLCLERILPPRRERHVDFDLPPLTCAADAATAMATIIEAVAAGDLTIKEAAELSKLVDNYVKALEVGVLERRVKALEEKRS